MIRENSNPFNEVMDSNREGFVMSEYKEASNIAAATSVIYAIVTLISGAIAAVSAMRVGQYTVVSRACDELDKQSK